MRSRTKFTRLACAGSTVLLVGLASAACGGGAGAGDGDGDGDGTAFRFAVGNPENTDRGRWEKALADAIAEETDGDYTVDIYWEGALGEERTGLEAVSSQAVQMAIASSSNTAGLVPEFEALDLPFIAPDGWDDIPALMESDQVKTLEEAAEKKGYKVICWVPEGFRQLMLTDDEPAKSPGDVDGRKFRVTASPIEADYVQGFGAQPTGIEWGETYLSLKQGTADGLFIAYSSIVQYQMIDAIGSMTELDIVPIMAPVMMNLDYFNSLPEEAQAAIETAGDKTFEANLAETIEADAEYKNTLVEAGIELYEPTAAELEEWHAVTQEVLADYPQYEEWPDAVQGE
jgi:TRAP-type C4-dicarboxylate transport system substrate-binding protein